MENIYAVLHKTKKLAYVGRTYQTIEERWAQHLRDASNPHYEKRLAEALRHEPDEFEIVLCEQSETASEHEWMQHFQEEGYELLNATGGNRKPPKKATGEVIAWKARPIYIPTNRRGVSMAQITQEQYEEFKALPDEETRWQWIEQNCKRKAA